MKRAQKFLAIIFMCMLPLMLSCGGGGDGGEADVTPPSVPTGLIATAVSSSQIDLSWTASTDSVGVAGYKVYRDGVYLKSVTTTSTSDTELCPNTQYCYTVSAYDAAGNESAQSSHACTTTLGFSTSDLQGTWNWHILNTGDAPQANGWAYGLSDIDVNGYATTTVLGDSLGGVTMSPTTFSVSSDGIVTTVDYKVDPFVKTLNCIF